MTNTALVLSKLGTLGDHVDRMERRRATTLAEFRADVDRQDALALSLLVALQEASDIALHIASDEGWGVASSYAASFELLARRGVIREDQAARLAVAALRNRGAHGYATVDVERIWREVPDGITILREYAGAIARFLAPAR